MVSSYRVVAPSPGCRAFARSVCFAKLAYSHAPFALPPHCRSRSGRAVRPASLAASARHSVCQQSPVRVGALCSQAWACRASKTPGFGRAGLAVQASVLEHSARPPVSQRLKPQCVVMQPHSNAKLPAGVFIAPVKVARAQPLRSPTEVSAFKVKRRVVHQPPNPSFKRTGLRPAA